MITLEAKKREVFGKKLKSSREEGNMPVVVYGSKEEAASFFVNAKAFKKVLKEAGESTVVSLKTGTTSKDVLIHDVAYHPVSDEPLHADLFIIDKDKKLTVSIPLIFEGVAPAIKELGGLLVKVLHELEVEALPKDLPHDIKVDITSLKDLESQITIADLKIPAGVEATAGLESVVAAISVAEEEEEEVKPEAPDLESIEVEKKGKEEVAEASKDGADGKSDKKEG